MMWRAGLSLFRVRLPEPGVRTAVSLAAAFNLLGMVLERVILRKLPGIPLWPLYVSGAVGLAILFPLLVGRLQGRPRLVS
jgi:hypothetical protein